MKWSLYGTVTASTYVGTVEADTAVEAIDKGLRSARVSLCHQCERVIGDPEITSITAESDNGQSHDWTDLPTWEDQARAAGWTPPKAKAKKIKTG